MGTEKFSRLWKLERRCYKCGRALFYRGFYKKASFWNIPNGFEREIIEEMWENPIFVLECCWCFKDVSFADLPTNVREMMNRLDRVANMIRENREAL